MAEHWVPSVCKRFRLFLPVTVLNVYCVNLCNRWNGIECNVKVRCFFQSWGLQLKSERACLYCLSWKGAESDSEPPRHSPQVKQEQLMQYVNRIQEAHLAKMMYNLSICRCCNTSLHAVLVSLTWTYNKTSWLHGRLKQMQSKNKQLFVEFVCMDVSQRVKGQNF